MMEKADQDGVEDLLQQLMQGADTATEIFFLDSLLTDQQAACGEKPKEHRSNNSHPAAEISEKCAVDVSVCDIQITLNNTEISDQKCTSETDEFGLSRGSNGDIVCRDLVRRDLSQEKDGKADSNFQHVSTSPCGNVHNQGSMSDDNSMEKQTRMFDNHVVSTLAETLSSWLLPTGLDGLCDAVLVEKFVQYVFVRRFGAADQHCNESGLDMQRDPHLLAVINRRLDDILKRMMELPVTGELVSGYATVLKRASAMPTLRKKLLEHVMLWQGRRKTALDELTFKHMKGVVVAGLSDVWSAVRKTCSAGVARLFRDWSSRQQEDLFTCLLEICINKEGSWQSKDGSALCVHAIVHSCFTPSVRAKEEVVEMPGYMVECVLTIVFSLISHPQLSIRETVAKIMSAYMEHVDFQDMMDLMHQTLTLLTPPTAETDMQESFHCVEAYAAEGLLNICTSIVKVLPTRKATEVWLTHCAAFLAYLAHAASSVRQTSSTLLMHVATNRGGSAVLMKLVMHHLTQGWPISVDSLASCHHFLLDQNGDGVTWEGMEGRMFVYELLCKYLIEVHSAHVDEEPSSVTLHSVCSQDGGSSETEESVDQMYKNISSYLTRQSPLTQLLLLDNAQRLADEAGIQVLSEGELQDLQRWLLAHSSCLSHRHDDALPGGDSLHLPTCGELLMCMFHHTAACLAHPQWELRRIAQQMLPCVCEVLCLYSVDLVMGVWGYMTQDASLLSFLGLRALHHSLSLCARVVATTQLTSRVSTITNPIYVDFVDGVRRHVESYLPLVCQHLHREAYDKVSVVAAETALLALNFFDLHSHIQEELCSGIVSLWKNLFIFAHPKSAISTSLFTAPSHPFSSPYDGFLSCCLVRPESDAQCAKQVEKSLMEALHQHLPHFFPQLDLPLAAHCLPLLAHNIGLFLHDTEICKSLINSFNTLCQCTKKWFASTTALTDGDMSLRCVYFTIRELTAVIALKSLDFALLQKILNCYLTVCESLQPETHIPLLLQGVSARLSDSGFHVDPVEGSCDLDVTLCWNRPQLPPGFGQNHSAPPPDEDSLDHVSYTEESESDTSLNRSSSSLGLQMYNRTGRRRTLSTTDDILEIREIAARLSPRGRMEAQQAEGNVEEGEEEDEEEDEEEEEEESDWDSWSEEEEAGEELSTLKSHFRDFFQRLVDMYGAAGKKIVAGGVAKLGEKEQSLLKDLLT
ncbi:uncharacterized protein LOC143286109 [Babylonia areolata]|uniref:uncharacterized protein LOC143286109 n=1 Tax=Babylonia areolata TaxID=304850 RepID=UPI003FD424E8